jgi:hypothetical protein
MAVKIATVQTFETATNVVVCVWEQAGKPKLLRFEGFDGVGKSGLAKLVAQRIDAEQVEGDKFAFRPDSPKPYPECLRKDEVEAAIMSAVATGKPVIFDAVCLDEVAPISRWGRGFVVYVKRLSFNNPDPIWHDGFHLEDEEQKPDNEPHHGICEYHRASKPHERADLIIELRETGHTIYSFDFERSMCFDLPGAELLPTSFAVGPPC